jgi:hypothetical protein
LKDSFISFSRFGVETSETVQHRWRGAHGIPTLARGNEKKAFVTKTANLRSHAGA